MTLTLYSKENCIYCNKAKALLKNLGLSYEEKKLESYKDKEEFLKDIGKQVRSMPQIKIENELIGGYNQLVEYFIAKGKVNFKGEVIDQKTKEENER
jgi:glutaredoxin|tara:strand:+ start:2570 stop:2860 length:291 start_codon:yes stop_codon:yes gene_type:complete